MSRDCVTLSYCTPLPTTSIVMVALRFDKGGACFPFDSQKWMQSDCQLESFRAMTDASELTRNQRGLTPLIESDCQQSTGTGGIECGERRGERAAGKTHLDVAQRGELSESSTEARNDASDEEDDGPNLLPLQDLARNDTQAAACGESEPKRMGRDSNPRWDFSHSGFQDRRLRPLGHPSKPCFYCVCVFFRFSCLYLYNGTYNQTPRPGMGRAGQGIHLDLGKRGEPHG